MRILQDLHQRGIEILFDDGGLVATPASKLTDADRKALQAAKPLVLRLPLDLEEEIRRCCRARDESTQAADALIADTKSMTAWEHTDLIEHFKEQTVMFGGAP